MTGDRIALLLDLDGVVVYEAAPPVWAARELLLLHQELASAVSGFGPDVAVLTHRSRREAARILASAGFDEGEDLRVFAAEDLFQAARRGGGFVGVWKRGLKKSAALPGIEKAFGLPRSKIVFVDDRMDNLNDMLEAGIGLALLAPSEHAADGRMTSFSMNEVLRIVEAWRRGELSGRLVKLQPTVSVVEVWQKTGLHTRAEGMHLFNVLRSTGRRARQFVQRLSR
jgi:hypothetical protein